MHLVDHSEGSVAGIDQMGSSLDDAVQHGLQVEVGPDRENSLKQARYPIARTDDGLELGLDFAQEFVGMVMRTQVGAERFVFHIAILLHGLKEEGVDEAPGPVFTWLDGSHDRMSRRMEMRGGVPAG
jgi:hypothetical protein